MTVTPLRSTGSANIVEALALFPTLLAKRSRNVPPRPERSTSVSCPIFVLTSISFAENISLLYPLYQSTTFVKQVQCLRIATLGLWVFGTVAIVSDSRLYYGGLWHSKKSLEEQKNLAKTTKRNRYI